MWARMWAVIATLSFCVAPGADVAWSQDGEEAAGIGAGPDRPQASDAGAEALAADLLAVTTPYDEEVVVRGQRSIWRLLERAEDRFFERFNAINSNDDFDIKCELRARLGTTIKRRVCEANFWAEEDANIARTTVFELQGSSGGNSGVYWAAQTHKSGLMLDEMARLAQEDPELRGALENLVDVRRRIDGAPASSSTREVVVDGGGALPYGAESIFAARVGRRAWTHALTNRTFTFAEVDGDIFEVEAHCANGIEPLPYRADIEWTLPAAWGRCEVSVEAMRGTTFYLLEFQVPELEALERE